jgi:hypothetical protein
MRSVPDFALAREERASAHPGYEDMPQTLTIDRFGAAS